MTGIPSVVLPKDWLAAHRHGKPAIEVSPILIESAAMPVADVFARLEGTRRS